MIIGLFALIALFIVILLFRRPLKFLLKIVMNSVMGWLFLFVFNVVGNIFGFTIAINLTTVLVTGVLGLPGFILLILVRLLYTY